MTDAEFVAALLAGQREMRELAALLGIADQYNPEPEAVLRARWGVSEDDDG
jgi:hypothetical protein